MTTTIRSSADSSKSYIAVGGTDRITIDAATGKLTSTYSPPTGERSLALATMQKFADEFGSSLAASGYQKLPSGLIIQWGELNLGNWTASTTASNNSITFPVSFSSACYAVTANPIIGAVAFGITAEGQSITGFTLRYYNNTIAVTGLVIRWIALGK